MFRAGDILGALTGQGGIEGKSVGKVNLFPMRAYVAVEKSVAKKALRKIESGKMKGRQLSLKELMLIIAISSIIVYLQL